MVAGSMYWKTDRQKRKEFEGLLAEKKAQEKNAKWILELEARDAEDKAEKAAKDARKQKAMAEKPSNPVANSVVEESERRRKGVLEMVEELILSKK